MAIAITEGCIDGNADVVQVCSRGDETSVVRGDSGGGAAGSSATNTDPVPFHRHCQKTVCSAYQGGAGLTWPIINILTLDNLSFITEGWKTYFTSDCDNITNDLASILKLIDKVAGNIARNWNLRFYADGDATHAGTTQITSVNIKPWNNTSLNYDFRGFSRNITLSIDGKPIKFNTMRNLGGETLDVDFDKNDITVKFNGTVVGQATNIYMPDAATIDIKQDFNAIPGTHGITLENNVNGGRKVYRHSEKGDSASLIISGSNPISIKVPFKIDSKYNVGYVDGCPIVEWEFHLVNSLPGSQTLVMDYSNMIVQVGDISNFFSKRVVLNDQNWVEPGKTNVYVFRADMWYKTLTISLAYVY